MCGFAGMVNLRGLAGEPEQRLAWLQAMGRQMQRRGPDDQQTYDDGYLSLVFRRLSIIDLDGGQQPIWNEDRSILGVVNGEIFNHRELRAALRATHTLASESDAEVLVHLYEDHGADLLQRLNGMFALLVWDAEQRRLLLARDRLGIKPLFYAQAGDNLLFASELKALLAHPLCPRELNWSDFEWAGGFRRPNPTFVRDVEPLPGGHYVRLEPGASPQLASYWRIEDYFPSEPQGSLSAAGYRAHYAEILAEATRGQLMSDVPIGLFLSGGIDSSLLACHAAGARQDLHCFTVVEESTQAVGDVSEAQRLAQRFGVPFYPVHFPRGDAMLRALQFGLEEFEYLVWAIERPGFVVEWLLKSELHRFAKSALPDLKVILVGQGADEFAGGYSQSLGKESGSWDNYLARLRHEHRQRCLQDMQVPAYFADTLNGTNIDTQLPDAPSDYHQHMRLRTGILQSYMLWHEDRTSSGQGIEARVPFLDHRLVELLASIPEALHEELFFDKAIVRHALRQVDPAYPPQKSKVEFYNAGNKNSIRELRRALILRVYPAFRDKYLLRPEAIFSVQRLDEHVQHIVQNPNLRGRDMHELLECMAIEIFADLLASLPDRMSPTNCLPPSPLQLWQPEKTVAVDYTFEVQL